MTAAEAYESVTNGGTSDFATVVRILEQHPPWCLIDGLAINCYVEPVYTVDADIVAVAAKLSAITQELHAEGFTIRDFPHSVNAQRGTGKLNIQFSTDPRYQHFVAEATPASVLGLRVPVAKLEHLVEGKIWAWSDAQRRLTKRMKDELDLVRLAEAYPHLRNVMPDAILRRINES